MFYNFSGTHPSGQPVRHRVGIVGTSVYWQASDFAGQWFGFVAPFGMPRPGQTIVYFVVAARRDMGDKQTIDRFLDLCLSDQAADLMKTLSRFFDYLRRYPRAHPSAEFIK